MPLRLEFQPKVTSSQYLVGSFRRGVVARTANPVDIGSAGLEVVAILNTRDDLILGYAFLEKDAD